MKPKAIFLLGPTASGKTAMALALARRYPAEIVSVDSAQVYCDMDVGTAKPTREERSTVPHHLIDILDPTQAYSAGRFRSAALRLIEEIHARGRVPILAGGTMLYFSALLRGLAELPSADAGIREELEQRAGRIGWAALHTELARVDPATAERIGPTDPQRIQRALEVYRLTGIPLSELQAQRRTEPLPFAALLISLEPSDRAVLHERIAARFQAMLAAGLVAEVIALREHYRLDASLPAMRSVGYRQVWQTLEGEEPPGTLESRGIAATRQLAKRQLTWLRSMAAQGERNAQPLERLDCLRPDLEPAVLRLADRFLGSGAQRLAPGA